MRIAITGASGLIGRSVVRENKAHELVLLGRSLGTLKEMFPDHNCVETDYSEENLKETLNGCDAVIHLAARLYDPQHPELSFYLDNVECTERLYKVCSCLGIVNIVFASTRTIYDPGLNSVPFSEDELVRPSNAYAISKHTCELLSGVYKDLRVKNLRFAQIIGAPLRPGFMLKVFVDRVRNGENLTVFGSGLGARDYLYVDDAAQATLVAVMHPEICGIFNVGFGRAVSHLDFASAVANVFGDGQVKVMLDKEKPDDRSIFLMDSSHFMETFDWEPSVSLETGLKKISNSSGN